MASSTKQIKNRFKNKISGAAKMSAAPKTQQEKLQNQIENYQKRLKSVGLDSKEVTDTRNPIEKALNLKQDQNFIFDLFELINRPQQALFTGINNAIKGKDFVKGLQQGISGEKETSGGDILRSLGMEGSGKGNLFTKEGRKELSLSDVLGFGLDLFADPIDLALAPVKVTSTAGKAVKAADNVSDTLSKGAKLVKSADTIGDTAKGVKTASSALNVLGDVGKTSDVTWKPLSSALLSYAGQGIKKGVGKADNILEKLLGKSDAKNLTKLSNRMSQTGETIEEAARALNISKDKLQVYRDLKKQLSRSVDSSKNLMGLTKKAREARNLSEVERRYGQNLLSGFNNDIDNIANNFADLGFKSKDEAIKGIKDNLVNAIENNRDWTLTGKNVIDRLVENKNVYMHNKFNADEVVKALKEYGIKAEADGAKVKLLSSKSKLYNIQDAFNDKLFGSKVSENVQKSMDAATNFFKQNDELRNLYNNASKATPEFANLTDALKGTNFKDIATTDYARHTLAENVTPSEAKAFNARKYDAPIAEVNEMKRLEKLEEADKLVEQNKKIKESIYTTNAKGEVVRDKTYIDNLQKQHQASINRLQNSINSQKELAKGAFDETGKRIPFDASKVDIAKLNKKDTKLYNQIIADQELTKTTEALEKIKFDDIAPTNTKAIDNLSDAYKDYTKWVTSYKEELAKKAPNERKLDFIKAFVDSSKKNVTAQIAAVDKLSQKQVRETFKIANKAYKEGKSLGSQIQKAWDKLKISNKKTNDILSSIEGNVASLNGKLNYEQETLNKLIKNKDKIADDIFNKKVKLLEDNSKAINILSDPEAQKFFKTSFDETFLDFVNRSSSYTESANKLNEALSVGIFNNPEYIKTASDLVDNKIPFNFEKVSGTYLKNKISAYKNMLPKESQGLLDRVINNIGDEVYLDKDFAKYLKVSSSATKEVTPLLKLWDGMNNIFKKFSTLSLGFQTRNIIGNTTDMVLSGASAKELPKYYQQASEIWNKADDLFKKFSSNTLTEAETKQWETLQEFYKAGFLNAFEKGQGLDTIKGAKGLTGKLSKASVELNNKVDTYNRLALLLYAKEHPEYVSKLGRKNAVDAVKMVLFDPDNMSDLERNAFKRIIPFYTFTKQNLMFQAENVMRNTPRYNKLFKSLNKAYDAIGEDSYSQYQKENMQIPLPFTGSDGNQLFLKANLPVSDLGEYLSKPLQRVASSASPLIRTPYEMTFGKSTFTGEDTNYKTLSNLAANSLNKLGVRSQGIENAAQAAEHILNNFGLQNVSTNLIKKVSAILDRNNDNISDQQLWAEIFRSVLQNTKQESVINSGLYNELEAYQAIIKRLKNQGVDVPTITQLNQINKMKLNKMKNKRASSK